MEKNQKTTSWTVIIALLIIFWPVGLFLLIKKLSTDKGSLMTANTTMLTVVGWCLLLFGIMGASLEFSEGTHGLFGFVLAAIFSIGGFLLIKKSRGTKRLSKIYRNYIDLIVNHDIKKVDDIASTLSISYEEANKNINDMISKGYLGDAYLHQSDRKVILKSDSPVTQSENSYQNQLNEKVIKCNGCGANNVVSMTSIVECEYCGTPLSN